MIVSLKVWQLVLSTAAAGQIISEGAAGRLCNSSRVQEFPQWRKCDRIRTGLHRKHGASVPLLSLGPKPTGLCSLRFNPKNTLNSVQVNLGLSCLLWKLKSTLFFFVFFPRMAALDCNRSCCVTAGKNMHDLVKGWIQSYAVHFQMKKRKSLCFLFQCFFFMCVQIELFCFMMIISGYINLKDGKIINNSPLDTVYHRCLLIFP